uniref:Uncharacterized protein n=1 Tax=Caenorhabditis japonica TaxID=281687 RepID=A0A8R1EVP7_CAEJA
MNRHIYNYFITSMIFSPKVAQIRAIFKLVGFYPVTITEGHRLPFHSPYHFTLVSKRCFCYISTWRIPNSIVLITARILAICHFY